MQRGTNQGWLVRYLLAQRDPSRPRWLRGALRVSGALTLLLAASLLVAGGWLLGDWLDEEPPIVVERPVENIVESELVDGRMPNVLGLDRDDAVQAIAGAGADPAKISIVQRPYVGSEGLAVDQQPGPAEEIDETSSVTLVLAQSATMPDLAGERADEAADTLAEMGATVSTERRYAGAGAEGEVLSSSPPAGRPLAAGNVELVVGDAPSSVFLASVDALTTDCEGAPEEISVNGRDLPNSLICHPSSGYAASAEYVLKRRAEIFEAQVGISDESENTGATVTFRVWADGRELGSETVPFGSLAKVRVSTANALRLRISARASGGGSDTTTAVWGSAKLIGGREAIDSLSSGAGG